MKWILAIASLVVSATCWSAEGETKTPPIVVTEIMAKEYPSETGSQGRMLTVEFEPGAASKPHTHPGAIFAYVLEGSVVSGMNNDEAKTYKTGESWYEHPGCVHRVSRNASATQKAKLLVFFVTQPGKPILEPLKE